jgi:hypothetical protein
MRPLGDRRTRIRLEVIGSLWADLDVSDEARIVNISRGGALVEARIPAVIDSTRTIKVRVDGIEIQIGAKIRHLTRVDGSAQAPTYEIGLEFIEAPAGFLRAFD